MSSISRRKLITTGIAATAGVSGLVAATRIAGEHGLIPPDARGLYGGGHTITYAAQRLLTRNSNAREFKPSQISKTPHPTAVPPKGEDFKRLEAGGFKDWHLQLDGFVDRPGSFSMADLRSLPTSSQITQLICEEGWSYIAQWNGVALSQVLTLVGVHSKAKYAVYYAMDGWIDAIDMNDAWHPQTLISYGMNSGKIPVGHGGPLRLRVPRQLGYKSLKFLNRITLTDTLKDVPLGDYSWYAGI